MKIARLGDFGNERPAVFVDGSHVVFVDHVIEDWSRKELELGALEKVQSLDLSSLEKFLAADFRIGAPISNPTKIVCIGLNYARHARETGVEPPREPVVFMKAPDTLVGPNDDILIPPGSTKTDYEVELAVVIGSRALYLKSPEESPKHILGFSISQDVSERYWQMERGGQWVKGKSFPTFNPMGPQIVTSNELDASDLRVQTMIDGEQRQDSRTSDLIFDVNHIVWYVSQVMELQAGDIINTGTPEGVGLGFNPPKYLKADQEVVTKIEGIGEQRSWTRATR